MARGLRLIGAALISTGVVLLLFFVAYVTHPMQQVREPIVQQVACINNGMLSFVAEDVRFQEFRDGTVIMLGGEHYEDRLVYKMFEGEVCNWSPSITKEERLSE